MSSNHKPIPYPCPYCQKKAIETTANAPFVRGFLVVFQYGSKTFLGCRSCVRKNVLKEAGLSCLIGWFSPKALIANPLVILYNVLHAPFITVNVKKARQKLREAGIPDEPHNVNITKLGYALAISMIQADGEVEEKEIAVAIAIGTKIFADFNQNDFLQTAQSNNLPSPKDTARILRDILDQDGKALICQYLAMIAQADGSTDASERTLLETVMTNIGLDANALAKAG